MLSAGRMIGIREKDIRIRAAAKVSDVEPTLDRSLFAVGAFDAAFDHHQNVSVTREIAVANEELRNGGRLLVDDIGRDSVSRNNLVHEGVAGILGVADGRCRK